MGVVEGGRSTKLKFFFGINDRHLRRRKTKHLIKPFFYENERAYYSYVSTRPER
jgi:hypothetical protein